MKDFSLLYTAAKERKREYWKGIMKKKLLAKRFLRKKLQENENYNFRS